VILDIGIFEADKCDVVDPKYEEEVSGCTASVGIITHDKIYVVSACTCS
jgi:protein phosphatase PTC2/3